MTFIPRLISTPIKHMAEKYPILMVTGPRQSGKTTLLREQFPEYHYVNLEQGNMRSFALEDPIGFLQEYNGKTIIDEAQRVPSLFSYLQVKVDEYRKMGQYILSGSQNFLLMENVSQSLAGRVGLFKLLPLSLAELMATDFKYKREDIHRAIYQGGYPTLFDRDLSPSQFFPTYLETYIERDVRSLSNVQNLNTFRGFLQLCAGRVGQPLNIQSLGTEAGISSATVKNWLSILEASFVLFRLNPYFANINKRVVKSPKLYFYDTGLLCQLLNLSDAEQLKQFYSRGSLFENYIIVEMMKNRYNAFLQSNMYFWRDSNRTEVDIVMDENGNLDLFEIKMSQTIQSNFLKGIRSFRKASPSRSGNDIVFFNGESQRRTEKRFLNWLEVVHA